MSDQALWRLRIPIAILLGLILRIPAINAGLWFDEIQTLIDFGRMPFAELLQSYGSDNNHPLYSILARSSIILFGESPFSLRLPALVFGILGIYEVGRLGRLLLGAERGVNAAFILALASPHIWFSSNARGYTALLYFSLLATRYLVEVLREPSRLGIFKQALALALATYVHATAVTLALAQVVVAVAAVPKDRRLLVLKALVLGGIISLVLHATILMEMLKFFSGAGNQSEVESTWSNPLWMLQEIAQRVGLPYPLAIAAAGMGLVALLFGLRALAKESRAAVAMFTLPALFGALIMFALGRNLWPRFFFFEFGAAIIIVLAAIKAIADLAVESRRRLIEQTLTFGVVLACLLLLGRNGITGPKQDFVAAAKFADTLPAGRVATIGLAQFPMADYLERDYRQIATAEELAEFLAQGDAYVINTLPVYLEDRQPKILELCRQRGEIIKTFFGTLGGGEVVIWQLK